MTVILRQSNEHRTQGNDVRNHGKPWSPEDVLVMQRDYGTKLIEELAAELGRSYGAVREKASALGLAEVKRVVDGLAEAVLAEWHVTHPDDLADRYGVKSSRVYQIAKDHGLGPRRSPHRKSGSFAMPVPAKPCGFSRATLVWARQARGSDEAALILGIVGELPGYPADPAARGMA